MKRWVKPAGSTAKRGYDVHIDPDEYLNYTGLYVTSLGAGESRTLETGDAEWLVLPLAGSLRVESRGQILFLTGRKDPFSGPTDFAYVPVDSTLTITSSGGARVALPHALARKSLPFRRIPAEAVVTEIRGRGTASRQFHNFGTPDVLDASTMVAYETFTPGGNWSSYPPHKHDAHRDEQEAHLEEIYYFELQPESFVHEHGSTARPFGYFRVYASDPNHPIDVLTEVHTGDVVVVPYGWHGPATAPPGYEMYHLNVLAGPDKPRWVKTYDPAHEWVHDSWHNQEPDPRLRPPRR